MKEEEYTVEAAEVMEESTTEATAIEAVQKYVSIHNYVPTVKILAKLTGAKPSTFTAELYEKAGFPAPPCTP